MTDNTQTRCGFAALIGATNAGKSTLLNRIVGEKVSIVSHKVQTTRSRVSGIVLRGDTQIVFVDTPGLFEPKKRLERSMVDAAHKTADDVDVIVLVVDVSNPKVFEQHQKFIARLQDTKKQAVLCLNKTDAVGKDILPGLAKRFVETGAFSDVFAISALKGKGTDELVDMVAKCMPQGPWLYPEDMVCDMPMRLMAAEITREKIFERLHQELPYVISVQTENWQEDTKQVTIDQTIYVQKDGQKAIVLGKGGTTIKAIGTQSRQELERLLEKHVRLNLFVKVREKWMDDPAHYTSWGLDFNA